MKMSHFIRLFLLLSIFVRPSGQALAQANPYDGCAQAYVIENPAKWCSASDRFTTVGATPSGSDIATCFANFGKDVWFKFTAVGSVLKISVKGTGPASRMMPQPEFVIFQGDCDGQISLIGCTRSRKGKRFASLRREDIVPGRTYLVSVQDANRQAGQFQICITNYSPKVLTKTRSQKHKVLIPALAKAPKKGMEITLPQIRFDANSYEIKSSFIPTLFEVIRFLKTHPDVVIEVEGHTNSNCDEEYCRTLSDNRARAIAEFIISKNVPRRQVLYKGYGKSKPLYTGSSPRLQAKNQRVAIRIVQLHGENNTGFVK